MATAERPNVRFEVLDVATLPQEPAFDLIVAFDAISSVLVRIGLASPATG
jgi:hypothetical protein